MKKLRKLSSYSKQSVPLSERDKKDHEEYLGALSGKKFLPLAK